MNRPITLKPIPLWVSLLCFGVPTVIGVIGLHVVMSALARAGLSLFWNYMLTVVGMFPLLLGAALVAYRLKNTTPGLIVHFIQNGLGYVMILLGTLGLSP